MYFTKKFHKIIIFFLSKISYNLTKLRKFWSAHQKKKPWGGGLIFPKTVARCWAQAFLCWSLNAKWVRSPCIFFSLMFSFCPTLVYLAMGGACTVAWTMTSVTPRWSTLCSRWDQILYVQEVVTQSKILNRTILSNLNHVTSNYFALWTNNIQPKIS